MCEINLENMDFFKEPEDLGYEYRKKYVDSIGRFIQKSYEEAAKKRQARFSADNFLSKQEEYRQEYMRMLGIPTYTQAIPKVQAKFVGQDVLCNIFRLSIEVIEDFYFYGILFVPHGSAHAPLVIAQHGGGGSPEFCSDMCGENNYSHFTKKALTRQMVVFAPQILTWGFGGNVGENKPDYKIPYNRGKLDSLLKHLGFSITGLEIFCIMRSLDYLLTRDEIDSRRVGMMGLSYGGFFSLYTGAADTRIKAIYSAAAFNDKTRVGFGDWRWTGAANQFLDAEAAALCIPRKLWIDVGKDDRVFDYSPAVEEAKRAEQYYKMANAAECFRFNLHNGGHRFDNSNKGFDFFFKALQNHCDIK